MMSGPLTGNRLFFLPSEPSESRFGSVEFARHVSPRQRRQSGVVRITLVEAQAPASGAFTWLGKVFIQPDGEIYLASSFAVIAFEPVLVRVIPRAIDVDAPTHQSLFLSPSFYNPSRRKGLPPYSRLTR